MNISSSVVKPPFTMQASQAPPPDKLRADFIATLLAIVLAAFAAYAITRLDFPGRTTLLAAVISTAFWRRSTLIRRRRSWCFPRAA